LRLPPALPGDESSFAGAQAFANLKAALPFDGLSKAQVTVVIPRAESCIEQGYGLVPGSLAQPFKG
jgi:hypothetical protein